MAKFSFIIPVYNRGSELRELLTTISSQTERDFQVVVVDDGSEEPCKDIVSLFEDQFDISYQFQNNQGPGPARNNGSLLAKAKWLLFLDSDCLLPNDYLAIVRKEVICDEFDCFGGPDKAHPDFNTIQKAIGYAMSSLLTTGGIRGGREKLDKFYPRSYNLGVRKSVFQALEGFSEMRFGEDLDFSMRLLQKGYSTRLIKEAYVFHKRRNNFASFFKQVYNSGIARINLEMRHKNTLKLVHTIPSLFVLGHLFILLISFRNPWYLLSLAVVPLIILFDALNITKELKTAFWAVPASFVQIFGYGLGFISAFWRRIILRRKEFIAFQSNFYK
ncbi:MAG TPA: glycosyltransferase [Marinilabiliaceae bacterium]|nr:glycosyltransferase [Marinilabiliaceae bacterium]